MPKTGRTNPSTKEGEKKASAAAAAAAAQLQTTLAEVRAAVALAYSEEGGAWVFDAPRHNIAVLGAPDEAPPQE